jgi:hypothetical protein
MKCISRRETSSRSLIKAPAALRDGSPSSDDHDRSRSRRSSCAGELPLTVRERILFHVALHIASTSIAVLERLPAGPTVVGPQSRRTRPGRR